MTSATRPLEELDVDVASGEIHAAVRVGGAPAVPVGLAGDAREGESGGGAADALDAVPLASMRLMIDSTDGTAVPVTVVHAAGTTPSAS